MTKRARGRPEVVSISLYNGHDNQGIGSIKDGRGANNIAGRQAA